MLQLNFRSDLKPQAFELTKSPSGRASRAGGAAGKAG
jgi:hypothetical protein